MTCTEAFDLFFKRNFGKLKPMPARTKVALKGNVSNAEGWNYFFNPGKEGSEGNDNCFSQDAVNACEFLNGKKDC